MKLGSLFDGSGGFPLAGVLNCVEPVWAAEIEPYPIAVTKSRFPMMKHYGDVSKMNGAEVEPVDIITFGSPCQDMSIAGKREGLKHEELGDEETTRSGLFFEAVRIIKEMREETNGKYPRYAVWENVPGAFSSNKGYDFHAVLEALCSICDSTVSIPKPYDGRCRDKLAWNGAGEIVGNDYSIAWRTLDAQYWGVPQRRKRIYLVADFTGRCAGEILFKQDSLRGNLPQGDETGQETPADVVGSVDGSVGESVTTVTLASSAKNAEIAFNISPCLMARAGTGGNQLPLTAYSVDGSVGVECIGYDMYNQASTGDKARTIKTPVGGDDLPVVCVLNDQGGSSINVEGETLSPTLRANSHQHEPVIAFAQNQRDEVRDLGDKAGALAAEAGVHQQTYVAQPVIALQGNGIDRAADRHAVCYDARENGEGETACTITGDHQNRVTDYTAVAVQETLCFNEGQITSPTNGNNPQWNDPCHTLSATDNRAPTVILKKPPRKYIIRRLTPTECARLQGFPDKWGHLAPYNPADADFWESVRKTYAEINGKTYKPTKNIKAWYEKLHNDGAEYKMWGNGIALPCAEYVIRGIASVMMEREVCHATCS